MKIVKEFILREIAGECILIPTGETTQEFNGLITISETAKFIWQNLEVVDSLDELVDRLLDEYEIDKETATKDAVEFIGTLMSNGFIVCTKKDKTW